MQEWISVDKALPKSMENVLIAIKCKYNGKPNGKYYITTGAHCNDHEYTTEDYGWIEYEGDTEYDEEKDCFWVKAGWWETNFVEDNGNWEIDSMDGEVTHWMRLPDNPEVQEEKEKNTTVCHGLGYDACDNCNRSCPYR